ncbi:putative bifunctional diguanylate cyclase/phosphodiesterase [Rugamonas brunnea]|nr:EAL domain-containing protein [Rugamonas brunnea]
MSPDPSQYAYISVMADAILSAILLFLWLMQRKERHALYWAMGQLSIMGAFALWFSGVPALEPLRRPLGALLITAGAAGYWAGTQFFLGGLRRADRAWPLLGFVLLAGALQLWWNADPAVVFPSGGVLLCVVMVWTGLRLGWGRHLHRYRLLGLTMVLRGLFNLAGSLSMVPQAYLYWFVASSVLKSLSMLGLIYAVQHEIRQRYASTIDSLSNGFLIRDKRGYVHVANERCASLLGYGSAADLIGRNVTDLLPGLTRQMADDYFAAFEAAGARYPLTQEAELTLHNGARLPVEMMASPYIERGRLYCLVQLLDISERKKKDALLYQAARVDPVTGLGNRYALAERLRDDIAQAHAGGRACALLFIDLDKFKRVNDSFGHSAGDELLRKVAQRLQALLGPRDMLARFGGDEFIAALPDLAPADAEARARACAQAILAAMGPAFDVSHHTVAVTASIGLACYPRHGDDGETLLRHADIAMYEAKKAGRGELRFFSDAMNAAARDALVIDGALRHAIAANEFRLEYQVIAEAGSGKVGKVEALLRWRSATLGTVAPDRFIPVAEDSGLIVELGGWVLEEACRQAAQWRGGPLAGVRISINVSAWQLADPGFVPLVEATLARHGVPGALLELELTERVLIDDGPNVRNVLERLRALDVSVSLDDFGTGYSSLSYLTQFQLNTLKIDRAFVMDIEHSTRSNSLVHAIIAMGHSLGLQLVAEGVETDGQARILARMGCHYLQGFHIARPAAPEQLLLFVAPRSDAASGAAA